jgi:phosphoglycolate phosphatase-like HAD superfamily hydrolase
MRYDLIVWDFDGTLADSLEVSVRTYNALAPRFGCKPVADVAAARGLNTTTLLKQHGVTLFKLPRMIKAFLAAQRDHMTAIRLFPGVPEVLRDLRGRGLRLGVLSSNAKPNILACLDANGVADVFEFVVGYPRLFGKAKALRRLLKTTAVPRDRALYVGDEARDVAAAREVGVDIAAVGWGFHTAAVLAAEGPTHFVADPSGLPAVALQV